MTYFASLFVVISGVRALEVNIGTRPQKSLDVGASVRVRTGVCRFSKRGAPSPFEGALVGRHGGSLMRFAHGGAIAEGRDESPLREWVSVLGRHRTTVIVAVIVATLAAFFASANQERLYEASATVLVNQQNPTAQALNLTSGATAPPDRYAATQAALARVGVIGERAVGAAHIEGQRREPGCSRIQASPGTRTPTS